MEISARAWDQLGVVPSDTFRKVKRALENVAQALQDGVLQAASGKQQLTAAGFVARYRTDAALSAVVLDEVRREESSGDELTSTGRRRRKG